MGLENKPQETVGKGLQSMLDQGWKILSNETLGGGIIISLEKDGKIQKFNKSTDSSVGIPIKVEVPVKDQKKLTEEDIRSATNL